MDENLTFNIFTTQFRRELAGEGESCRNLMDCSGALDCCANKVCSAQCGFVGAQIENTLGGRCLSHFDCLGLLLCCP